jgi:selenocysteine-specific elongation factor
MPQTREHLAILDLLGVESGVVAITKTDLVDDEWLELVVAETEETLAATTLRGAPLVAVSSTTKQGLDELRRVLQEQLARERTRKITGKPRLPVDRIFTMPGFGTVVTGTLVDGELRVGQEVELQPSGRRTRIRGLQSHRKKVESVPAGTRVAVNVSGLATEDVSRGHVLTSPSWLRPTKVVDARLRLIKAAPRPLAHNAVVSFHAGSAETLAKVGLLDRKMLEPGDTGWAQIRLHDPLAVTKGDLFIVRWPSPSATIGGGTIVEPHPKRHRRFQGQVVNQLEVLERGTPEEIVLEQLVAREPTELEALARRAGLPTEATREVVATLVDAGEIVALDGQKSALNPQTLIVSAPGWDRLVGRLTATLEAFHRAYPLRRGMPKEEIRTRLGVDTRLFQRLIQRLLAAGRLAESGPLLSLAEHRVQLTPDQERQVETLLALLCEYGPAPPDRADLEAELKLSPEVTQALLDQGRLVEVSPELLYPKDVYDDMVARVVEAIRQHGTITVAGARDLFGTSRKYALALMGHLDERKITRRVGDERVLM